MRDDCLNAGNLREMGKSNQAETKLWDVAWILQGLLHWALAVSFDITCLVWDLSFPHSSSASFCL